MKQAYKYFSIKITFALVTVILTLSLIASFAFAASGARVYMEQVDSAAGTLVVDVIADEVTDLYGVEFRLNYDPAVLSVLDAQPEQEGTQIEPGAMLPVDQGFIVVNAVDQTAGTVTFAMTLLNPAPAVSGRGSLGRVTFNILQDTPSTINVTQADLVSADLQLIPAETTAFQIGHPHSFPWWLVGGSIIGLAGLAIVVVLITRQYNSKTAASPKQTVYSSAANQSRPSAFKPLPVEVTQEPPHAQ